MNAMPPNQPRRSDTLFVANTRPTAPGGVPLEISMAGTAVVVMLVLVSMNPAWFLLLLPGWAFLRAKCSKDLHVGSVIFGWISGAGRTLHRAKWGGSTVSPLGGNTKRFGVFR